MSQLKQLIESIVRDVLKELAPEAPKDAPFGQYLWAPDRLDLADEQRKEDNTPHEEKFFQALVKHYAGEPDMLGRLAADVKNMVDLGWYEKILVSPEQTAYRYISDVPTRVAAEILGTTVADLEKDAGEPQSYGPGTYKPGGPWSGASGISSWTTDLDWEWVGLDLVPPPIQPGQTAIILAADAGDGTNFFINPNTIHDVDSLPDYAYSQSEVIAHGPVRYARAWALTNPKSGEKVKDAMEADDVFFALQDEIDY